MSLKTIAAAKLLLANWSCPKLDRLLEQTEIRMSRALDYVSPNNIKVSCIQMALRAEMPAKDCLNLIISNLNSAVADGSQLVVFPEYIGLLPLLSSDSLFDYSYQFSEELLHQNREELPEYLQFFSKYLAQPLFESYTHFFSMLAIKASIYILAGTTIVKTRDGLANRAFLFDPDGNILLMQDKLHLSPEEKLCGLIPGTGIKAAETKLCRVSILIGQDQRVFEAGRAAHLMGSQLLLCPSAFSSSLSSAYFQSCAFMRCQEHPMFAISSWLTGTFMDLPFRAISGIYAPFSASKLGNGIIMQTDRPSANACLTARIDLERLSQDPDLYISDLNPAVEEMARQEYALARHTEIVPDDGEDESGESIPDAAGAPANPDLSEAFHAGFEAQRG